MKFQWFKFISNNLTKILSSKSALSIGNAENNYFREQFIEYLEIEDCLFCYQMIDEGYKPSPLRAHQLDTIMLEKIKKSFYKYNDIANIKSIYPKTKIAALLKSLSVGDYYNRHSQEHKETIQKKEVLDLFQDKKYKHPFLKYIKDDLNYLGSYYSGGLDMSGDFYNRTTAQNDEVRKHFTNIMYVTHILLAIDYLLPQEVQEIKQAFKDTSEFIEKKTSSRHEEASFSRIGKSKMDKFVEDLSLYQTNFLSKDNRKENVLRQLKSAQARQKPLDEEMHHLVINEEYSIENLPIHAKNQVDRITKLVKDLESEEVDKFVQERLPTILKKYFSIDEEYRTSLKNVEGYNAQELMIQSLENIERIMIAKKEDNNYDLIKELSIENRKLKVRN